MKMVNVLSRYSKQDIIELFSRYYDGFLFAVGSDGTAGIKIKDADIESCKARFIGMGFELVADKYLVDVQRKNYDFFVFYTDLRNLSDNQVKEAEQSLLEKFDEVEIKKSGEIIVTKYTQARVLSYVEEQYLIEFLKKHCNGVKLIKRVTGISKFLCKWQTK